MSDKLSRQAMQQVTILGATGTIGMQTLDVIAQHPKRFGVFALSANNNVAGMLALCKQYQPQFAVMLQAQAAAQLSQELKVIGSKTSVLHGEQALSEVAAHEDVDIVMAAIVGAAGLHPAMAAAKAGKRILLANKETLVMAGKLFMQAVQEGGATLLPIDSEHNAIFQAMPPHKVSDLTRMGVKKILLTASGGPFRNAPLEKLQTVNRAEALNHPNWVMGPKITIDSATLMNKGLEVIEAKWLFHLKPEQIDVVVHPQSIIHSMVQFTDGSIKAQMGLPDMKLPIQFALAYPHRIKSDFPRFNFANYPSLTFEQPDLETFKCLNLAFDALHKGGNMACILNAANEVAVAAFLQDKIGFLQIPELLANCMAKGTFVEKPTLTDYLETDAETRTFAAQLI